MVTQFLILCAQNEAEEVRDFGIYFEKYYAYRPEEWALGLRGLFVSTTTMSLEAFHHILKHYAQYMNGKVNHRLDTLIEHLYLYNDEMKYRELIVSSANRVRDETSCLNYKDHCEASKQSFSLVNNTVNGWNVQSFADQDITYEVNKTGFTCSNQPCLQACWDCGVCFHQFSCSCPRVVQEHGRVTCKHSHLVNM